MKKSFSLDFIKIYIWQIATLLFGGMSFFIVTPFITKSPIVFGVYSACISVLTFLTYADLGFLSSGLKFASESFAQHNKEEEMKIIGLVTLIMGVFSFFYSLGLLYLAFNPTFLIKGLSSGYELAIAGQLLLILAIFSPNVILRRVIGIVFSVRVEDYIPQQIYVFQGIVTMISIVYFFGGKNYDIVGYFLFVQVATTIANIVSLYILQKRYQYDLIAFIAHIRFSPTVFKRMKNLAASSFYLTIMWILMYEADVFVISKFYGAKSLALYSIGITFASFFRLFTGGFIYSPFIARFNHFIGKDEHQELRVYFYKALVLTMPIVIIPTITTLALMRPFILGWVGKDFEPAIGLNILMIAGFLFSFLSTPSSIFLTAKEKVKELNFVATATIILFWGGVLLTQSTLGIYSFAVFKCLSLVIYGVAYTILAFQELQYPLLKTLANLLLPIMPSILFLMCTLSVIGAHLPEGKSIINMSYVLIVGTVACGLAFGMYVLFSKDFRGFAREIVNKLLGKYIQI